MTAGSTAVGGPKVAPKAEAVHDAGWHDLTCGSGSGVRAHINGAYDHVNVEEVDGGRWREEAACAGRDGDLWFPARGEQRHFQGVSEARAICDTCPVQPECLAYALRNHINHGLWGGRSPRERRAYRRSHGIPTPAPRRPLAAVSDPDWTTLPSSPINPTNRDGR